MVARLDYTVEDRTTATITDSKLGALASEWMLTQGRMLYDNKKMFRLSNTITKIDNLVFVTKEHKEALPVNFVGDIGVVKLGGTFEEIGGIDEAVGGGDQKVGSSN